jgi:hypothetical protein
MLFASWENAFKQAAAEEEKEETRAEPTPSAPRPIVARRGEQIGEVVMPNEARGKGFGGGALRVQDWFGGYKPNFMPGQPQTMAELKIFAITEVIVTEKDAADVC